MRFVGCGLLLLAFASPAFAGDHYVEIWNPPEARGGLHDRPAERKPVKHKHVAGSRNVDARAHRQAPPVTRLKVGQRALPADNTAPRVTPDPNEIPRQITPEGNILRVGSRGRSVEVVR